jgi:hypothetical protein
MNILTDQDVAFIEELVARGVAIPAVIVGALLDHLRASSPLDGSNTEIAWLAKFSAEGTTH